MPEPDIEKGKGKKRRHRSSARLYENLNKPVRPRSVAVDELARDDAAEECATPDAAKGTMGNVPPGFGRDLAGARTSEPLTAGRAATARDDHGVGQGRSAEVAWRHPSLRQGDTSINMFANARSVDPSYAGNAALSAAQRTARPFSTQEPNDVAVDRLNLPMLPQVRALPSGDPTTRLPAHQARGSAVPPNGSHSVNNANRPPVQSMKASDRREILRQAMFGGGDR